MICILPLFLRETVSLYRQIKYGTQNSSYSALNSHDANEEVNAVDE